MKISGSRVVIECLVEQGVDTVFGYPGGAILNVYDEFPSEQLLWLHYFQFFVILSFETMLYKLKN